MIDLDSDQLASILSELSQTSQVPKLAGGPKAPAPFASEDVSFDGNEWISRVLDVQIWLNLDAPLDPAASADVIAKKLFDELSEGKWEDCVTVNDGAVELTEVGAQLLEERLSRAQNFKDSFIQFVEDERPVSVATEEWLALWDDPTKAEPLSINASVDRWRIYDIAGRAEQDELELNPTYQRDFVWSNADSQMLIESILRGIPLPSIILARMSNSETYQIVDGKQRLTAILRFMGRHPEGLQNAEKMKEFEKFHSDFPAFQRKNALRAKEIRDKYLPFKTKKYKADDPLAHVGGKYYTEILDKKVQIAGAPITIRNLFERACNYFIPVLIYNDTRVSDIHRVFRLYNQQGMKLNAEEIRNAVFNHLIISRLMLFVSGDRPEPDIVRELEGAGINPFEAHRNIKSLGFGTTRFRRTKVLLWAVATLILKTSTGPDGGYRTPSTASHIDEFLRSIDENKLKLLQSRQPLVQLANDLVAALQLQQDALEAWHPRFRRKGKSEMASKWEELPIVASLVACLTLVVMGEEQRLLDDIDVIHDLTKTMVGPESTQNKTQWGHIANASTSILEALGIDLDAADKAVKERYGESAIPALAEIRKIPI